MKTSTSAKEPNLSTAGRLLLAEFATYLALSMLLANRGLPTDYVFAGLIAFNIVVAVYLAKAARAQGKRAFLYGLISCLPPGAIFVFWRLWSHQLWSRLDQNGEIS
jgi:hypothetical protein